MKRIRLPLGERSYHIVIGNRLISRAGHLLKGLSVGTDAFIVSNPLVARLYSTSLKRSLKSSGISSFLEIIPDSEKAKSISVAERVLERIASRDTFRKVFIIALGGGVAGDLAGFLASVYKRGVPYVQIPTTLLAQVDSSIGGKVALDLPVAKNMVGSFYQPRMVISDTDVLKTLPRRQLTNGMAEIIKYGIIKDPALFAYLEKNYQNVLSADPQVLEYVIARSAAIKAAIVSKDEYDTTGLRAILNYGHTIGHAIEATSRYSGRYSHGEAVGIGMICAARISNILGMLDEKTLARITALIKHCGLPTSLKGVSLPAIVKASRHDKKFVNKKNRLVLPKAIGKVKLVEGIPEGVIMEALKTTGGAL
ncbi:MAG: 3-dehydroquinate synthase [Candidatus Omnitrophica bacterium]|nr:3-dehydroquinate synthase [Candidatus Omnitrophota bacterium]